eukprot:GHVS01010277.1.p1 GENE.GHVS01010277.1~~GHVS01010277.1.p1  ORF type:complete len:102 (-),score=31.76 GHVS01010277.1:158-463(-)
MSHVPSMEAQHNNLIGVPSKALLAAAGGEMTPQTPSTIASFPVDTSTPKTIDRSPTDKLDSPSTSTTSSSEELPARRLLPNAAKPASKELLPFTELEAEYL